jgi:hypothetical protein
MSREDRGLVVKIIGCIIAVAFGLPALSAALIVWLKFLARWDVYGIMSLANWRQWVKEADVLHAAD